ncbi:hypothetical protein [Actibacterium ureilyticum]|uniref:hypothetical protein n=1 Tax=Actibacterium ureilyticum TaxID=1590614 RepID=UPI000BAB1C2C|nr:hypothetical protein [Actibacterium ureilyticum]
MKRPLIAALICTLMVAGCARVRDSRINPFNWFGQSEQSVNVAVVQQQPADPRPLVLQITDLRIDRAPGGAIVHAVGLPPRQGYWQAELVRARNVQAEPGVLVYDFRAWQPVTPTGTGTPFSRELTAARFLSDQDLAQVTTIVVRGQENQRLSRR